MSKIPAEIEKTLRDETRKANAEQAKRIALVDLAYSDEKVREGVRRGIIDGLTLVGVRPQEAIVFANDLMREASAIRNTATFGVDDKLPSLPSGTTIENGELLIRGAYGTTRCPILDDSGRIIVSRVVDSLKRANFGSFAYGWKHAYRSWQRS